MTSELNALPWVLLGVVLLAIVIGLLAGLRPEVGLGKRWEWKGK